MSFLKNRPHELLALIRKFEFRFRIAHSEPATPITSWLTQIVTEWTDKLTKLRAMYDKHHLRSFSLDLTIMAPALLTFRLREGICGMKQEPFLQKMESVIEKTLAKFSAAGQWPDAGHIYDATNEIASA